ncbi:MAG: RraA family protein [Anaerolineae bacterium]
MSSPKPLLSDHELAALRRFSTPTIANAIEVFGVRPHNVGFADASIRCLLPLAEPIVGYAATACIRASAPPQQPVRRLDYWRWLLTVPAPRIVVVEDLDEPPAVGSLWGDVNVTIHKTLGCIGTVTNGGVRDMAEVERLGFAYFASAPIVSHAYVHLTSFGKPVRVGGLTVEPGDLLHADQHGVLLIPPEVAPRLADMAARFEAVERAFLARVRAPGFSIERLAEDYAEFDRARAALREGTASP